MNFIYKKLFQKKIIKLSKIEESFFLYKKLDKRIKLTSDLITINYIEESPFFRNEKSQNITSITEGFNLYIWFHKDSSSQVFLPEALLLYRKLLPKQNNSIVIIKSDIDKILVIKEKILVSSFAKRKIEEKDIVLLKNEFFIEKVFILHDDEYQKSLEKGTQYLTYKDFFEIFDFKINLKEMFNKVIKWMALPFLIGTIVTILFFTLYKFYLQDKNEKLLYSYREGKKTTNDIKERVDYHEELNTIFYELSKEFKYVDKKIALFNILKTAKENNLTVQYIRMHQNTVDFILKTKESEMVSLYIKKLFESNYFKDIKNVSSRKLRDKTIEVTMYAQLKER